MVKYARSTEGADSESDIRFFTPASIFVHVAICKVTYFSLTETIKYIIIRAKIESKSGGCY